MFLIDIFGSLLGYTSFTERMGAYTMQIETASPEVKGGKTPDARLGFYGPGRS